MAGVWAKVNGSWLKAAVGPTGIGTFAWVKVGGVWVLSFGGANVAPSFYVKVAGVWIAEEPLV